MRCPVLSCTPLERPEGDRKEEDIARPREDMGSVKRKLTTDGFDVVGWFSRFISILYWRTSHRRHQRPQAAHQSLLSYTSKGHFACYLSSSRKLCSKDVRTREEIERQHASGPSASFGSGKECASTRREVSEECWNTAHAISPRRLVSVNILPKTLPHSFRRTDLRSPRLIAYFPNFSPTRGSVSREKLLAKVSYINRGSFGRWTFSNLPSLRTSPIDHCFSLEKYAWKQWSYDGRC